MPADHDCFVAHCLSVLRWHFPWWMDRWAGFGQNAERFLCKPETKPEIP